MSPLRAPAPTARVCWYADIATVGPVSILAVARNVSLLSAVEALGRAAGIHRTAREAARTAEAGRTASGGTARLGVLDAQSAALELISIATAHSVSSVSLVLELNLQRQKQTNQTDRREVRQTNQRQTRSRATRPCRPFAVSSRLTNANPAFRELSPCNRGQT